MTPGPFPNPRLQADPPVDLARLKEADATTTRMDMDGSTAEPGIAHIPIDRAIAIVAKSGLPVIPGARSMGIVEAAKPISATEKPADASASAGRPAEKPATSAPRPERKP